MGSVARFLLESHTLPVLARFAVVLALGLWVGASLAMFLATPVLWKRLDRSQAAEIAGLMLRRIDRLLLFLMAVLLVGIGYSAFRAGTAPSASLAAPAALMVLARLVGALAVAPAAQVLAGRLRDANAPATDAERAAFSRLHATSSWLVTLEIILGVYALYAIS